jgi:hypothetical protein
MVQKSESKLDTTGPDMYITCVGNGIEVVVPPDTGHFPKGKSKLDYSGKSNSVKTLGQSHIFNHLWGKSEVYHNLR